MKDFEISGLTRTCALFCAATTGLYLPIAFGQTTTTGDDAQSSASSTIPTHTVLSCNDGDTCQVRAADNSLVKVRLVGIDSPEMTKRGGKKKGKGQPGGEEAKAFLNKLLVGKPVLLRHYGSDIYGRTLAEIIINNQSANVMMVSEGWAEVYRGKKPSGLNFSAFEAAEQEARQAKRGIWSIPGYISPKEWRKKKSD